MEGDVRARPCDDVWEWFRAFRAAPVGGDGQVSTQLVKAVGFGVATHVDGPTGKKPGGNAFPSWDTLAEYVGVHRTSVGDALDLLANTGWLIRQKPYRTRTIYQLAIPANGDTPSDGAAQPTPVPPSDSAGRRSKADILEDYADVSRHLAELSDDARRDLRQRALDAIPEGRRQFTPKVEIKKRMWALWNEQE